jgi:hypothetical protein
LSRTAQYAIFRYFNATVGWLMHTNKHDVNNTIANGNTNLVLGSDNTCDARSTIGSMCVGHNNSATGYVDNIVIGAGNTLSNLNAIAVGTECSSTEQQTIIFGKNNTANGYKAIAIGADITSSSSSALSVGRNLSTTGVYGTSLGQSNTASGPYSVAIGQANSATGDFSSAVGNNVTASGLYSSALGGFSSSAGNYASAVGYSNESDGVYGSAFGSYNQAQGINSSAFGFKSTAGGAKSSAFGYLAKTTVDNTVEIGRWANGTTRGGGIRTDTSGVVQFTIEDSATAPVDGGATQGSEAEGNLGRGMFTIHKNGSAVTLYYNNAGTIESVNLGTLV